MKPLKLIGLLFVTALVLSAISATGQGAASVRKIVVFQDYVNEPAREALTAAFGGVPLKHLPLVNGMAVLLPPRAVPPFAAIPEVVRIEDDAVVTASAKPENPGAGGKKPPPPQPPETLPWGVDRIDAELAWSTATGAEVKVAILDTGIDLDHPDLAANVKGGVNTINRRKSAADDNGHGTHVAGIVAALDNDIGVIGVAPKASLYAVKVLDRTGSGFVSDVIEGLQWCIAEGMDVVNMSLGTPSDIQSFHDAVTAVYAAGITQVAAAGNSGGSVEYPAAYPETIAVSATDSSNTVAPWSSYGEEIDLAAPGVNIPSTYKGDAYKTLSGTSMAAPHVTGTVALVLEEQPGLGPDYVLYALTSTADDLGDPGRDDFYGYGLVDAEESVTP